MFYELILLHNRIYCRCYEFPRVIIFLKYISQSNKYSVIHLFPPSPEVVYTYWYRPLDIQINRIQYMLPK